MASHIVAVTWAMEAHSARDGAVRVTFPAAHSVTYMQLVCDG